MPVISREQTYINGEEFVKQIRVLKDGIFRIKMPDYVNERLGIDEIEAETQLEVNRIYKDVVTKYLAAQTTETKVILYQFKISGFVQGPAKYGEFFIPGKDDPEQTICLHKSNDFSFDKGMIVGVKARVFIESRNEREDGEVFYRYTKVDLDDDLPLGIIDHDLLRLQSRGEKISSDNRLEWTQERHDFFVSLYEAMSQLIMKIKHLTEPKALLAAINNQKKLEWSVTQYKHLNGLDRG